MHISPCHPGRCPLDYSIGNITKSQFTDLSAFQSYSLGGLSLNAVWYHVLGWVGGLENVGPTSSFYKTEADGRERHS